ncbi:MAG: hypothetical protein IKT56_01715 [Clostridia bacterium]|nr:hypothetical protein [Clostridia bacterium]
MNNEYEFLVEKEEIWARMLMEVLEDNNIPFATKAVYGAGFVIRTGIQECLKIYVPTEYFEKASELTQELFSEEDTE